MLGFYVPQADGKVPDSVGKIKNELEGMGYSVYEDIKVS